MGIKLESNAKKMLGSDACDGIYTSTDKYLIKHDGKWHSIVSTGNGYQVGVCQQGFADGWEVTPLVLVNIDYSIRSSFGNKYTYRDPVNGLFYFYDGDIYVCIGYELIDLGQYFERGSPHYVIPVSEMRKRADTDVFFMVKIDEITLKYSG